MTDGNETDAIRYVVWKKGPIAEMTSSLATFATAWEKTGYISRELGLDSDGRVIHRMPSDRYRHGDYGLVADSPPFDVDPLIARGDAEEINADQFEELWGRPDSLPPQEPERPSFLARLLGRTKAQS